MLSLLHLTRDPNKIIGKSFSLKRKFMHQNIFSDAEEELNKLAQLADRINSQIGADESFVSNNSQNVDLDQLFNFLSQVKTEKMKLSFNLICLVAGDTGVLCGQLCVRLRDERRQVLHPGRDRQADERPPARDGPLQPPGEPQWG